MLTKVLISVKTYPTLSKRYSELVCTAGLLEDGTWVRIYPLPFRGLEQEQKYKKWQWIELDLERNYSDIRPESYKVKNLSSLKIIEELNTGQNWYRRKEIVNQSTIYEDLTDLIAKANQDNVLSLATFKPAKIINFVVEAVNREWDSEKLAVLEEKSRQLSLFQTEKEVKKEFEHVDKLPCKFSYKFEDIKGKESTLMIEDWEIGALYWNCLKNCKGDEEAAIQQVRSKYFDKFIAEHDILLFLGTTARYHGWANNPFVIVGVFYPGRERQESLF